MSQQKTELQIFYRSDTRAKIWLSDGFKARKQEKNWCNHAIRKREDSATGFDIIDVDVEYAVSMSSSFEASALFPLDSKPIGGYAPVIIDSAHDTYIYIVVHEVAKKIRPGEKFGFFMDDDPELKKGEETRKRGEKSFSEETASVVLDIHTLQTSLADSIMTNEIEKSAGFYDDKLGLYVAGGLYAYEACTNEIRPEQIYCAVKIRRSREAPDPFTIDGMGSAQGLPWRRFEIIEIIKNQQNFSSEFYDTVKNAGIPETLKNMQRRQAGAKQIGSKATFSTPRASHGLGGKTLPSPLESSFEKIKKMSDNPESRSNCEAQLQRALLSNSFFSTHAFGGDSLGERINPAGAILAVNLSSEIYQSPEGQKVLKEVKGFKQSEDEIGYLVWQRRPKAKESKRSERPEDKSVYTSSSSSSSSLSSSTDSSCSTKSFSPSLSSSSSSNS